MKPTTRALILALALAAAALAGRAQADTLYLRDGEQAKGRLTRMSANEVWFEGAEGEMALPKEAVLKIQLQRSRQFDHIERSEQITDPELRRCIENQPTNRDFPADAAVVLYEKQVFDLSEPGELVETNRSIVKVLEQRGEDAGSQSIWYFEDTDTPRIDYALTVTQDGRVLHLTDDALKNESLYAALPAYRRLSRFRFACKEPRPGSILDVHTTARRGLREWVQPFYRMVRFRGNEPVLHKEIELVIPLEEERKLFWQTTGPDALIMNRTAEGNLVRLRWTLSTPQPGIRPEPHMPPTSSFAPTLTLSYINKASASIEGDDSAWERLSTAYAEKLGAIPALPGDLAEQARALFQESGVQAIHNFVARNIRTVGIPHWHYSVAPHPPAETAARGLANELDKNFLYFNMLDAAGVACDFALVRGRSSGPLADDAPSLRAFDRSAVLLRESDAFSSASSEVLPFGTLPADLQGARALVIRQGGGALAGTQAPDPQKERDTTLFEAALDADGNLDLKVSYSGTGNAGAWMRGLKDYDEQRLRNEFQGFAGYIHPAAVLEHFSTTDLADLGVEPRITLHCRIPGYAVKAGEDLMLFTLPAIYYSAADVGRPERAFDLWWDRVGLERTLGTIALPEGYGVYALPEDAAFDSPTVSYNADLKRKGSEIVFSDAYILKTAEADRTAYPDYKACRELRARIPRQRIILTRDE